MSKKYIPRKLTEEKNSVEASTELIPVENNNTVESSLEPVESNTQSNSNQAVSIVVEDKIDDLLISNGHFYILKNNCIFEKSLTGKFTLLFDFTERLPIFIKFIAYYDNSLVLLIEGKVYKLNNQGHLTEFEI